MTLVGENAHTLGRIPWTKVKEWNGLSENSYLEYLKNRVKSIIRIHKQTGSVSA